MKIALLIAFYFSPFFYVFCQTGNHDPLPKAINFPVELTSNREKSSPKSNISDIVVIDARFDSTSLGFCESTPGKYYSLVTGMNSANGIAGFLKDYLQVSDDGKTGGL